MLLVPISWALAIYLSMHFQFRFSPGSLFLPFHSLFVSQVLCCIELENMFKDDMGDVLHRTGKHV